MQSTISKLRLAGALAVGLAAVAVSGGCQYLPFYRYSQKMLYAPGERASETDAPHVSVGMANSAQFRAVPLQVQHAFALDYAGAAVTGVQRVPTGTGGMFYKIAYIENGTPGQAIYQDDGASTATDQGVVVIPESSLVPISPLPAEPSTQPTGSAARDFQ
jgi:hypothetical protein